MTIAEQISDDALIQRQPFRRRGLMQAFSLLEALVHSGCPHLFKGSIAEMLHLNSAKRHSIDIDIRCYKKYTFIFLVVATILMMGCTGNAAPTHEPQASDTLYTKRAAMDVYGTQPERALEIIDSAEIVGNLTEEGASLLRAKVFCLTCGEERLDTARQICETLLQSDFVKNAPNNCKIVLDLLVTISRKKCDNEQWLRWATEKVDFCREQARTADDAGKVQYETEALRTEAEIGIILTHLGHKDEGMAKLDDVIRQLDGTRKFNETDACIIALRRKVDVLTEAGRYTDMIPVAEKIIEKMNDYEQHPDDYHDGTYREPDAANVSGYCDFYRVKGYAYLANAYANIGDHTNARHYLSLFEQSQYGQSLDGRKMIAPTWCKMGDYDKMLATYDEQERLMGTDTICFNYAIILRNRAEAAEARGLHAQAYDYMSRHAALCHTLNDSLQASEAHEYATRYHAQQQQLQIEREQAKSARKNIYIWSFVIISLLAIAIAALLFFRNREISQKNRTLARQITEAMTYKEKYLALQQVSEPATDASISTLEEPAALFAHISQAIVREGLFLDPAFDRQAAIDYFHLSKERIGAAFSQGSDYASISDFINECRLEYAVNLLNDQPSLPVSQVARSSGFSDANYFGRKFKARFGLSPTEFRKQ